MPKERYPQPNKEQATKHFACLEYSQGLYDIPAAASHGLALAKLILIMWSTEPEKKPQHSGRTLAHDQMTQSKCRLLHLLSVFLCLLPHYFFFFEVCCQFSSVQFSHSVVSDSATPWTAARQAYLSITNSRSLLRLMSIVSVMPSNHLILCCPLLLPPSVFPSIRVFSSELVLRIWLPKYWSFGFNISPSSEYSGLISFRMD